MDDLITVEGIIENITFRNPENGFTVLEFSSDGEYISATGIMGELYEGERFTFSGRWETHPTYGRQFKIESAVGSVPETAEDMLSFLASGIIKGVKEKTAQKIVSLFGADSFDIISNEPSRLAKVPGISKGKAVQISQRFRRLSDERNAVMMLEKYGLKANECMRIFRKFGRTAPDIGWSGCHRRRKAVSPAKRRAIGAGTG